MSSTDPRTAAPRVSILIPNYNNGAQSSLDGQTNLIGNLLESLHTTLEHETTPFEILAWDDGSTDDSLDTLRAWSQRTWPDGRPFLQLTEAEHCGVLSIVANNLTRTAQGEFIARLDGDTVCLTRDWVTRLCATFDHAPPTLGVIGPKQLGVDLKIHSFGDWILHPRGYHHVANGCERHDVSRAIEVDHVMGCFYCHRRSVWEQLDGYDEDYLRGQTIDFGLRARLHGWSCWAVPDIEFIHAHSQRDHRATAADSARGLASSLDTFKAKWGFSRLAADLDVVAERYAGTPLLWNPRWFGPQTHAHAEDEAAGASAGKIEIEQSDWGRFATDDALRQRIEFRLRVLSDTLRQIAPPPGRTLMVGCGHGLASHLLATHGVNIVSIDPSEAAIELARAMTSTQTYPDKSPRYRPWEDTRELPFPDESVAQVLLFDQVEHHRNPTRLLTESARVLKPGGLLLIISARREPGIESTTSMTHPYTMRELVHQVMATDAFDLMMDPNRDDPRFDLVVIVRKKLDQPVGAIGSATSASSSVVA